MQILNKTSVFFAVIASGLVLVNTVTAAQAAGPETAKKGASKPGHGKRMGGDKLAAELGLTEAQQKQGMAIQADMTKQVKALSENKSLTKEQKRAKSRSIVTASMTKFMALLTPEQKKKFQEKMMQGAKGAKAGAHAAHKP